MNRNTNYHLKLKPYLLVFITHVDGDEEVDIAVEHVDDVDFLAASVSSFLAASDVCAELQYIQAAVIITNYYHMIIFK